MGSSEMKRSHVLDTTQDAASSPLRHDLFPSGSSSPASFPETAIISQKEIKHTGKSASELQCQDISGGEGFAFV